MRLRLVVALAGLAGATTLGLAVARTGHQGLGSPVELGAFTVVLALNWAFPVLVLRRDETEAFQLDEAFLVAMALLLPPLGTMVGLGLAAVVSQLARRRPLDRVVFNTGQLVTATGLALSVVHLNGDGVDGGPWALVAAVAGALVFLAANGAAVSTVIAVVERTSFWRALFDDLAFRLLVWAGSVAVGLLAALAGSAYSWALLIAALPTGVLQVVMAGSLRARREREQMDGLLRSALDAHRSVEPGDVEEAVTASARTLLQCRQARITETPPGPGELGSKIPGRGWPERWLIVSERRAIEPFDRHAAKLLDALAAVGSGALENAALVDQMKHQVFHDTLTGLPNQLLFEDRLNLALARAQRSGEAVAVLFIDLDRFKRVNDCFGHPVGNDLLRQVAARLAGAVRASDTVARMGGDEFTVLLSELNAPEEAAVLAEKLREGFRRPFVVAGQELFITPSIGIAVSPEAGIRPSTLVKNADTAMYRAKDRGRNCWEVYAADMNAAAHRRLTLEGDLYNAIDGGQLRVVYQPQVELDTGRFVGVEALVRWQHPTLGMVYPDTFIPLAEETGLIAAIDDWVLATASRQVRQWADAGLPRLRLAVNLSAAAFARSDVVERVSAMLGAAGLEPDQLELEITERMAVDENIDMGPILRDLEALGVHLAIDDFGTGYSALSRLQGFPFHTLKIDRSFVMRIEDETDDAPLVAAMIAMGRALDLEVVAEGVETPTQRAFLDRHGCRLAQGYLFSRPVDAGALEQMLRAPAPIAA